MTTAIVAAADAAYFRYLRDLIRSIHAHRPNADIPIHVLDIGLEAQQRDELSPLITGIVEAKGEIAFPAQPAAPSWFKAMVDRPFLPKYFPQYDRLIWI